MCSVFVDFVCQLLLFALSDAAVSSRLMRNNWIYCRLTHPIPTFPFLSPLLPTSRLCLQDALKHAIKVSESAFFVITWHPPDAVTRHDLPCCYFLPCPVLLCSILKKNCPILSCSVLLLFLLSCLLSICPVLPSLSSLPPIPQSLLPCPAQYWSSPCSHLSDLHSPLYSILLYKNHCAWSPPHWPLSLFNSSQCTIIHAIWSTHRPAHL